MTKFIAASLLLLAGCAAVPAEPISLAGDWAGPHVALHLAPNGGTLDYDCAHGTIGPVLIGAGGRFVAEGTHTPEHGGPAREGEILPTYPAHYGGIVSGDRMMLDGRTETGVQLGPFELRRGAEPMLTRCY